ncbi:phosphate ABC transporter permease subunit PstC [Ahniella affigens]|uniref:Phosphate transport system permease protein n=1 Tax=Ahniella affigens TaxID=2021234 RepID=A0A2P1PT68_9GAMM|nr:phosphate ABC transporter permease subunit PstC [Ahniella affigens]AVP98010.1 phosphate ABC transporter permease subunit PstC [Ahniella affigens]
MTEQGSATPSERAPPADRARRDQRHDWLFKSVTGGAAWFVLIALAGALTVMFLGGSSALKAQGLKFITTDFWDPANLIFHGLAPIVGTLLTSLIALVFAVPVSFGIALFLTEVAPTWLRTPVATAIELLAGIPSIIYGMWGLFVLVPWLGEYVYPWLIDEVGTWPIIGSWFQGIPIGIGLLTAGFVLAIMIIPFISSIMREVFQTVPNRLKESAYALGSTRWEVVWDIVLPYTRSAVIGGVFLGLGRALGETMAVTFVIGNANRLGSLMEPGSSISATIANEFAEAFADEHRSALLGLGFLLFVVSFVVLSFAKLLLRGMSRWEGKK